MGTQAPGSARTVLPTSYPLRLRTCSWIVPLPHGFHSELVHNVQRSHDASLRNIREALIDAVDPAPVYRRFFRIERRAGRPHRGAQPRLGLCFRMVQSRHLQASRCRQEPA